MHVRYDEGDGPPVVLLHGQPGSASDWARVVPLLRAARLRVLAVDRNGYGGSRRPAGGWRDNAESLLDLLDGIGGADTTLVGWSWGGGVALEAARLAPERIRRLVLLASVGHERAVGPADRLLAAPGVRRLWPAAMNRLAAHGTALVATASGSRLDPEALEYFAAEAALWPATGAWSAAAVEQVAMVRDAPRLSAALPGIGVPATVVHGWRDRSVPVEAGAALAAALPDATLVPVDAGHLLPFEVPRLVSRAVLAPAADGRVDG